MMRFSVVTLAITFGLLGPLAAQSAPEATMRVPPDKTYFYLENGKVIATVHGGGSVAAHHPMDEPIVDCVQIPCPTKFGSNTVCWQCRER
jgi:hypothetical protein